MFQTATHITYLFNFNKKDKHLSRALFYYFQLVIDATTDYQMDTMLNEEH